MKKGGPRPLTEDQKEAKAAKAEAAQNAKRYELVMTSFRKHGASPKYGVWDGFAGAVIELFSSRGEAIEELARLQTGTSNVIEGNNLNYER